MCGVSGIVSLTGRPVRNATARIARMNALSRHRGPDSSGAYFSPDGRIALGDVRLAIVDAANPFTTPMKSANGRNVLSFNGEIYNFREERARLEQHGIQFKTRSDTEVLLEGLGMEGLDFLERLDGMWGFAFYDSAENHLTLARDLLGEKHLFYCQNDDELIFASEMNPVLEVAETSFEIDTKSLAPAFRFRVAPPERTLIKGVSRLAAGHILSLRPGTKELRIERRLRLCPEKWFDFFNSDPSESDVLDVYDQALSDACRMRVPDEVGFMTTLSGGLDSTLVNVYASDHGKKRLQSLFGVSTLTQPKKWNDLDELAASEFTSEKLGTEHNVFSMIDEDCIDLYHAQAANAFDGLLCEGVVCYEQLAKEVVGKGDKVLIVSDGPDELIGGYDMDISVYSLLHKYSDTSLRAKGLRFLSQRGWGRQLLPQARRKHIVNWAHFSADPFHFRPVHGGTTPDVMEALFTKEAVDESLWSFGTIPKDYEDIAQHLDPSQKMALSYATGSLPDYFNLRSDRGSMRRSVELRLPLQSRRLVELMIATPASWRFRDNRWTKFAYRKLVDKYIGPEIAYRGKYGFAYPAWHIPELERKLDFGPAIAESAIFDDLPFRKGAREFFLRPEDGRHRWMAYALAKTNQRLAARDYSLPEVLPKPVATTSLPTVAP